MNAQELRAWLATAPGKQMETANFLGHMMEGGHPAGAANGSTEQYFPCLVRRQVKPGGFGTILMVTACLAGGRDAIYVKDHVNQCLHADATLSPIVISGRFSGCTFARCVGALGHTYVAHIFVDANDGNNDPAAQARAFEIAAGAAPNTAVGFQTAGVVQAPSNRGYVIGTFHGGAWQWNWITCMNDGTVMVNQILGAPDWVAL
jgi:hypothetical protein